VLIPIHRYSLNYKGLPYKTVWLEYPDVASTLQSVGIPPTPGMPPKPDGSPYYTLPAIVDPNTGKAMSESLLIGEYLDSTYPDKPTLVPNGTRALMQAFVGAVANNLYASARFSLLKSCEELLNERSEMYIREARKKDILKDISMEDFYPKGEEEKAEWKKFENGMGEIGKWMGDGRFVMGDKISFADFILAGWLQGFIKLWGVESKEWKDIASWDGGRWDRFLKDLEEFGRDD